MTQMADQEIYSQKNCLVYLRLLRRHSELTMARYSFNDNKFFFNFQI